MTGLICMSQNYQIIYNKIASKQIRNWKTQIIHSKLSLLIWDDAWYENHALAQIWVE